MSGLWSEGMTPLESRVSNISADLRTSAEASFDVKT
jgi:hypothetical protein